MSNIATIATFLTFRTFPLIVIAGLSVLLLMVAAVSHPDFGVKEEQDLAKEIESVDLSKCKISEKIETGKYRVVC